MWLLWKVVLRKIKNKINTCRYVAYESILYPQCEIVSYIVILSSFKSQNINFRTSEIGEFGFYIILLFKLQFFSNTFNIIPKGLRIIDLVWLSIVMPHLIFVALDQVWHLKQPFPYCFNWIKAKYVAGSYFSSRGPSVGSH